MRLAQRFRGPATAAALVLLPACVVETTPPAIDGYATVYTDAVPATIYSYPHVWYGGQYVYLVGDRWYAPYGHRWVALRGEPPALYQHRLSYHRRPYPPASRPYYGYPRARR
jgi:hypothetical protein